jgi:hypothetical protein
MSSQPVMLSYAECHCGACRYSECHCELLCRVPSAALQSIVMLSVTVLSAAILSVIMNCYTQYEVQLYGVSC